MMFMWLCLVFQLSCCLVYCQHLERIEDEIGNNSLIYYSAIVRGQVALKCFTENKNCCSPNTGNWITPTGEIAHQGVDGAQCLYFERGDHVISLNRLINCSQPVEGLWRCDIPDLSGEIQSLFIFIVSNSNRTSGQLSDSVTINFTLHTEPRLNPPEFTISCQTHGGPATEVEWFWNGEDLNMMVSDSRHILLMEESQNHSVYIETSQTILDTSFHSVYDSKLFMRGRVGGDFSCFIRNNLNPSRIVHTNETSITVAGEPTNLDAVISSSTNTHVNITVSWESPADTVTTGYVIYYQPKTGGPVISESVTGGHRENHSLTGLQRGHTYNISIVALSQHLPSPLVGPVNVATGPLLVVETSPQSLNVTSNEPFSLTCTVRAEHDEIPVNTTIEWIRTSSNFSGTVQLHEISTENDGFTQWGYYNNLRCESGSLSGSGFASGSGSGSASASASGSGSTSGSGSGSGSASASASASGSGSGSGSGSSLDAIYNISVAVVVYESVLCTTENGTDHMVNYRCKATLSNITSASDTSVLVESFEGLASSSTAQSNSLTTTMAVLSSVSSELNTTHLEDTETNSFIMMRTSVPQSSINSTVTTHPRDTEVSIIHPSSSGPTSTGDIMWIIVTSALTVAVIVTIMITFLCCVILLKKTDKKIKPQVSQTLNLSERLELKPVERRDRQDDEGLSTGGGYEVEEDLNDVPVKSDIPVGDFPQYILDMTDETRNDDSKLAIEYSKLQHTTTAPYNVACLPYNIALNRFRNIYPYDGSRVPLTEISEEPGSDYINASFISGFHGSRYIAAQAPLIETIDHFWRMIWEYGVETIVMLTRCVELSREKCAQYWPESLNDNITPGDRISVTLLASTPYAEYHIRKFLVKHLVEKSKPMTVTQFHYTAWPDHGVPDNVMAIIRFIRHVRKLFPASQDPPLLVHCSAGVGRTGTFITLDMMMQQMRAEGTLSVCQCVKHLRTQRMKMVQTLAQYEFIHYALSELVVCGETEIVAANLRSFTDLLNHDSQPSISQQHMNTLDYLCTQQKCDFTGAKNEANVNKNRFKNKPPNDIYRVPLHSSSDTDSEYINASVINGYKQKNAYIATQGPLKETVEDFWRMMWEYRCGCIVMLCQLVEDGHESSYCYWPGEEGEQMVSGRLKVRLVKVRGHGDILERKLEVTGSDSFSTDILTVKMIQLTSWPLQELPHPAGIMSLIEKLNDVLMRSSSKQTLVMCSDGVVRSGTFLCIHSQLERLKTEGTVDVFQAIRSARIQRPGVVPNTDHYVFCYEVLADYVEKMEAYHNFKTLM